jgi:hypothetical protein
MKLIPLDFRRTFHADVAAAAEAYLHLIEEECPCSAPDDFLIMEKVNMIY